jgi:hypothetical protein
VAVLNLRLSVKRRTLNERVEDKSIMACYSERGRRVAVYTTVNQQVEPG